MLVYRPGIRNVNAAARVYQPTAAAITGATYTVTTVGAELHTIQSLGIVAPESVTVYWGDGNSDVYNGTATRTHNYAGAGTWTVTITNPQFVERFDIRDNKVNLDSAGIAGMVNIETFLATTLRSGTFDSVDVAAWRPTDFRLYSMPAGYAGTFDSADVAAWRPTIFYMFSMPAGYAGTFDSVDVSAWRPTNFYLYSMPAGYAGTFDSVDVSAWRPTDFRLYSMPAGYAGTFDSVDVAAWRPTMFYMFSMPAGYAGTFDSVDVAAWRPRNFLVRSMPAGYAGTFDSVDVAAWRPRNFYMFSMPAGYAFIAGGGFANWTTTTSFQMQNNALIQAQVDAFLWELYQASATPRTAAGGTIILSGTNAAPSGVFQPAAACPVNVATPGREVAHELLNDGCAVGFNVWATVGVN